MATLKDLTGQKFGRLTVLYKLNNYNKKRPYWLCVCECGNFKEVKGTDLLRGHMKSCGCLVHKHNLTGCKLHGVWFGIKSRCYNKNNQAYKNYGGRGIAVCNEWKDDFQAFYDWSMMNGYKEGLQIDRINNNGNYEPNNCRWVTNKVNCNNRRSNRYFTIDNVTHTIHEWCDILNINYKTLYSRLCRGSTIREALNLNEWRIEKFQTDWENSNQSDLYNCQVYRAKFEKLVWDLDEPITADTEELIYIIETDIFEAWLACKREAGQVNMLGYPRGL